MDQDFQTSFIPKKPMVEKRATAPRPVGLLAILAFFLFFLVLIMVGGLFLYKNLETNSLASMKTSLDQAKNQFEDSKIGELQALSRRLNAATEILANHINVLPIFNALSAVTMKTVQYTKFSYTLDTTNGPKIKVEMSGKAVGYQSIALQSDLFSKEPAILDPVFSNLSLDTNGNVIFDLTFTVSPDFVNYKKNLLSDQSSANMPILPASTTNNSENTGTAPAATTPANTSAATTSNNTSVTPTGAPAAQPSTGTQ